MSKKYFWLKLKENFFNGREIKKLRRIAGGDTFTIIYLKMQLLTMNTDGLIKFEGTEESIIEQLALELDEKEDNIAMTLSFLQANNLVEQLTQDQYLLNRVPEAIGSETGSAERMRRMRAKAKEEEQLKIEKRNNVTPLLQDVTQRREEKSRVELDKEKERSKRATMFENFWESYPKKVAKGQAKKTFNKITQKEMELILKDLEKRKGYQGWEDKRFIPNPSTYLNAESWLDEYETGKVQKKPVYKSIAQENADNLQPVFNPVDKNQEELSDEEIAEMEKLFKSF